jgi:hypothetical protein
VREMEVDSGRRKDADKLRGGGLKCHGCVGVRFKEGVRGYRL